MEGHEAAPDLKAVGRLAHDNFKNYMMLVKNGSSAGKIFLKENVDRRRWTSAVLVCIGVYLLAH